MTNFYVLEFIINMKTIRVDLSQKIHIFLQNKELKSRFRHRVAVLNV
jgi:hypothetical protein